MYVFVCQILALKCSGIEQKNISYFPKTTKHVIVQYSVKRNMKMCVQRDDRLLVLGNCRDNYNWVIIRDFDLGGNFFCNKNHKRKKKRGENMRLEFVFVEYKSI